MAEETETPLSRSLKTIDRMRMRVIAGGWLAVIVTLAAYGRLSYVLRDSHDPGRMIGAAVLALTCLIAWTSFAVILIVIRMAKRILTAIELTAH